MSCRKVYSAITVLISVCMVSSCSVTTAPIDASSGTLVESSTDTSFDVTSSTTQDDEGGEKKDEKKVEEFVTANFFQLRTDMSVGEGEYLTSLASLLAIDHADKKQFYAMTKNNFSRFFVSPQTTPKELLAHLKLEIAQENI